MSETMPSRLESLVSSKEPVLLDGAMGTELQRRGIAMGGEACLTHPEAVLAIHRSYVEAGTGAIITNTLTSNRIALADSGSRRSVREINLEAVSLAARAAPGLPILGDMSSTGRLLAPYGSLDERELLEAYREQALALREGGVDGFILETFIDLREALGALRACLLVADLPVIVTLAFETVAKGGRTAMGDDAARAARELEAAGARAVGANCGSLDSRELASIVAEMRRASSLPIVVQPNAGKPRLRDGSTVYDLGAEDFAEGLESCIEAGARIVGGCCGTTSRHIEALAASIRSRGVKSSGAPPGRSPGGSRVDGRSSVTAARVVAGPLPRRLLGRTGVEVPILGLGTGPGGMGLPDAEAIGLYHAAIDAGVTYLDTAPGYQRAQKQLASVLRSRRHEVFLATKVFASTREKLLDGMAVNLTDLGVERVDLLYVHSLGEQPMDALLAPDGALAALGEIKRRGWARFVGFTSHSRPRNALRAIEAAPDLDVVMLAMNYVERNVYGFEDTVLPQAVRRGIGVAAMKVYGGSTDMRYDKPVSSAMTSRGEADHEVALRYALGLPGVAVAVVGMYDTSELERNVAWAREWRPLTDTESRRLEARGREVAPAWGARYGPVE